MEEINLLEVLEHPEQITEEFFRNCTRHDQFMILVVRPEFRKLFLEIHETFDCREEFELIMNHDLSCEDALCKNEFSGHDIQEFIIEGVLHVPEFKNAGYAERLTGHNWSEILANTDPDGVWKEDCDFSKFDSSDWVNLLICNPEYAGRCPFEKLEKSDIDVLLREQPELAKQCGIGDAAGLYLVNDAPYETDNDDIPFYPPLPAGAPVGPLTAWLAKSFPEMDEADISRYVYRICFQAKSRLGVYSRSAAEAKIAEIAPGLKELKHLTLAIEDFNGKTDIEIS